jgi:hypothetical protein
MSRIHVTIVRSTAKAHLIEADGRQGWIQKRWLKDDGTVSAETFEKSAANHAQREAARQEEREWEAKEREFKDTLHRVRIVRQTEKAIATEVILRVPGGFEEPTLVWFPKSRVAIDGDVAEVPGWMIREREWEVVDNYSPNGRGYYERHRWCKGEEPELARGVELLD